MNPDLILVGFAIGLFLAVLTVGYRQARRIYWTQYQRELEDRIPTWVNQGRPVIVSLSQLEDEINFAIWETEMEDR